jgi:hypothetical protein
MDTFEIPLGITDTSEETLDPLQLMRFVIRVTGEFLVINKAFEIFDCLREIQ